MRILFIDTKPIRRGAQIFSHDLSGHYRKTGIDVKRIYLFKNNSEITLPIDEQDELFEANENNIQEKIFTIQPLILIKLVKCIKKYKPDIIMLNGSKTLKYGAFAKKILVDKYQFVYRVIDSPKFWNTSFITKFYYKHIVIPSIDAAVGVSDASLTDMKSLYGFNKNATVIHRAVNFESFQNVPTKEECRRLLNINSEKKVILFLGNLTSQKRPDRFIEIIKSLTDKFPDVRACIVGDGPLKSAVIKQIKNYNLEDVVTLYGYQQQVGNYICASDLLLLTSDTEGLPGVVPEAGYFSVPTIASNVGGVNECIENGVSGFVAEKNNIADFIQKSILLLSEKDKLNIMGVAAKHSAEKNFNINNVSKSYLDFFDSLIKNK